MLATGETVGLAEWIIDDTCLVPTFFAEEIEWIIKSAKPRQQGNGFVIIITPFSSCREKIRVYQISRKSLSETMTKSLHNFRLFPIASKES